MNCLNEPLRAAVCLCGGHEYIVQLEGREGIACSFLVTETVLYTVPGKWSASGGEKHSPVKTKRNLLLLL